MKKTLLAVISVLACLSASAEIKKMDVLCVKTENIMKQVSEFNEVPIVVGHSTEVIGYEMGVFYNKEKTSYSILLTNRKGETCVLDAGVNTKLRYLEKK